MKYHDITTDDMLNGDGLRVVLWVSGCEHHCKGCQNPITWNKDDGIEYTVDAQKELIDKLNHDYMSGLTLSGGDPLAMCNREMTYRIALNVKKNLPDKTIWCYTGYEWDAIKDLPIIKLIDVLVDGRYVEELRDTKLHWKGSSNQRVVDVKKTLELGTVVLV